MYSPFADGYVADVGAFCGRPDPKTGKTTTGHAKIIGDDPMHLRIVPLGLHAASPAPYGGRYPAGSLVYNGVWYYGTGILHNTRIDCNWCTQGPFVGFRISMDYGETWKDTKLSPTSNLFRETALDGVKVKMGLPHFVDFGKNMEHSPDGKAYLVAHGATRPEALHSWCSGDQVYMVRVAPSPENINDLSKYEFFAGHDEQGRRKWSRSFADIKPLVEWKVRTGCVTMTYNAPLKKYLMCITDGWPTTKTMNTYILESDEITGPWRLVTFMKKFGEQGYASNFPSRFISADGRTAWLCYSANYTWKTRRANPPGSRYGMSLHEVKFLMDVKEFPRSF